MFKNTDGFLYSYCDNINDSLQKLAYFIPLEDVLTCDFFCNTTGKRLDQMLFSTHIGYATFKNNFMFPLLQKVSRQLIPTGIPQYLKKFYQSIIYKVHNVKKVEMPAVLTLVDLEVGFQIWIYSCALTWVIFLFEIMAKIFLKILKKKLFKFIKQTLLEMIFGFNFGS